MVQSVSSFLRENARWIGGGFLLTYFSSFGQTFFISQSAGDIRAEYGLSHGEFGMVYMGATLASALTLPRLGRIVDTRSVAWTVLLSTPMLAAACLLMAFSQSLVLLALSIYCLRLFGQGMMNHISFTAMGKWFSAQRGRAISFSAIGVNGGEATLLIAFVLLSSLIGWRNCWLVAAALLLVVGLPAILAAMRQERRPSGGEALSRHQSARDWTRGEVLRDPAFYLLLAGVLAPPFIITTVVFHQIYLVELRGWSREAFAASFAVMSVMTVAFTLVCGALVDRFSAPSVLPYFLLPLAVACLVLAVADGQWSAYAFMALAGMCYGFASTLFGALWPEIYGTKHLGAVRSMIVAIMVFQTAAGPGLTGYLIDHGVSYPAQIAAMGFYCLAASAALLLVSRQLMRRQRGEAA
jgi:MFS family permease